MYRNQSRFGDPMAAYVKKRQPDEPPPISLPGGKRNKSGVQPPSQLYQRVCRPVFEECYAYCSAVSTVMVLPSNSIQLHCLPHPDFVEVSCLLSTNRQVVSRNLYNIVL